tara:strand:- start:1009 stop:1182 length:174 start_codon:yes stop_codon:yes gene_type:complete
MPKKNVIRNVKKVSVEGYKPSKKVKTLKKGNNVDQVHQVIEVVKEDKKVDPKKVFEY